MARKTQYHKNLVTEEKMNKVSELNRSLLKDFLDYCVASNKSSKTIYQYKSQLRIFFVWNMENNENVFFVDIKKRDYIKFFQYLSEDLGASPNRVASLRAAISSLSNYIERVRDDEFPLFKNAVKNLEPVQRQTVRDKTVIDENIIVFILSTLIVMKEFQLVCFLGLLIASGMRRSEALQMKVSDFTTNRKIILNCMYETGMLHTKGRGRHGKIISRYIFKDLFEPYLNMWLEQRKAFNIDCEYLFVKQKEGGWVPATNATINSWCKKISDIGGISFYPHAMRHYFTTMLKRQGYPDDIIVMIQKWANPQMVKVYNDLGDSEQLEGFFYGVRSGKIELKTIPDIVEDVNRYTETRREEIEAFLQKRKKKIKGE